MACYCGIITGTNLWKGHIILWYMDVHPNYTCDIPPYVWSIRFDAYSIWSHCIFFLNMAYVTCITPHTYAWHIIYIYRIYSWLVVSKIFYFHNIWIYIYMGYSQPHWLSYFSRWLLHHQPDRPVRQVMWHPPESLGISWNSRVSQEPYG